MSLPSWLESRGVPERLGILDRSAGRSCRFLKPIHHLPGVQPAGTILRGFRGPGLKGQRVLLTSFRAAWVRLESRPSRINPLTPEQLGVSGKHVLNPLVLA